MSRFASSLVLSTPTDFSFVLLDKWVDPKDLVNLDTAFCTMSCRSDFLDLLQASEFVMSSTKSCPLRNVGLFCDWIMKRQVKLSHLGHGSNPVDLSKIEKFIHYCAPNLRSINLVSLRMTAISDDGYDPVFYIVATHCHRLESIAIQAGHLPTIFGTILSNNAKSLRRLDIASNKWSIDLNKDLHFPELTELRLGKTGDLRGIDTIGLRSLEYFALRAPKLSTVSLKKAHVDGASLTILATNCKELKEISLEFTEANTQTIVDHCPREVAINLNCYQKLLPSMWIIFHCGLQLNKVDLNGTDIAYHMVDSICTNSHHLSTLRLARCKFIGVLPRTTSNNWPHLKILNLELCTFQGSLVLLGLLATCTNLTCLNLDGVNVNDSTLAEIGRLLPHLQQLTLNTRKSFGSLAFTAVGLESVLRCCSQLRRITIFDAPPAVINLLGTRLA